MRKDHCDETTRGRPRIDSPILSSARTQFQGQYAPLCSRQRLVGNRDPQLQQGNSVMPNIAVVLKAEITRLARREIRSHLQGLKKASAQFRRDIAELKRRAAKLQTEVVGLERQLPKEVSPKVSEAEAEGIRFNAKGLRSHRNRLGLSAASFAKLVRVSEQTIYNWERGISHPLRQKLAVLKALRSIGKREALARLGQLSGNRSGARKKTR